MMNLVKLSEYFEIHNGVEKGSVVIKDSKDNENLIPYIRPSQSYQDSLDGYVDRRDIKDGKLFKPYTLYVSTDGAGSHTYSYLAFFEFVPNSNVVALVEKIPLKIEEKLFYAQCITSNRFKFSYSRKPKGSRLANLLIPTKDSIPNFVYKHKIRSVEKDALCDDKIGLNQKMWQEFNLEILFDISGTQTTRIDILEKNGKGKYPYITTKATNNGCNGFYSMRTEIGNVITVDSAVIGYASYQSEDFSSSDHVEKLTLRYTLNKYIAMFLITILNKEQYRFHYGRKASQDRLKNLNIKLPATPQGEPDWEFMENYIKSLPYSASL